MNQSIFQSNTTIRWSCRAGDYVFWMSFQGPFAPTSKQFSIMDIWEIKDGEWVTITNRFEDLPPWFELHPLETSGSLAYKMMEKLNAGYEPNEIMDGPNLWRIFAGDRLVWVGTSHGEIDAKDGVS